MLGLLYAVDNLQPAVDSLVQLDVRVLSVLGGLIVPMLTALVTTKIASSSLKSFLTVILSVISGSLAVAIAADGKVVLETWFDSTLTSFITAIATYYGFWKPTSIAPSLQEKTRNFGLGPREAYNPDHLR